jgi:hypothetical protein
VSFDIYPAVHTDPVVSGKLEFVARGVKRLVEWTTPGQVVWNCIECTRIGNREVKPTPAQVRAEVWMALTHGSHGLIYFVHQFEPTFREAALFDDPEMLAAVTRINRQIHELAPVLNCPTVPDAVEVRVAPAEIPVSTMVKRHAGSVWLFAVSLRPQASEVEFRLPGNSGSRTAEVLGESRAIEVVDGSFSDRFEGYAVHLYRLRLVPDRADERGFRQGSVRAFRL